MAQEPGVCNAGKWNDKMTVDDDVALILRVKGVFFQLMVGLNK